MSAVVMVQGTASSVGKSLMVTALCRIFARQGLRVAPFKAQNMALNSAVTPDGLEIGRAQAVQAAAAGIAPRVELNPVLIKPEGHSRAQIVVEGRPWRSLEAVDFYQRKQSLWEVVTRNLDRLRAEYDLVIIEGAGSPAEINLKAGDIVNMRVACYAGSPVVLTGDIDRGGVFAAMVGTLMLLEPDERALVRALLINRFRGDQRLLRPGLAMLEERAGVPVLGVVPYLPDLRIAQEDGVWLERHGDTETLNTKRIHHRDTENTEDLNINKSTASTADNRCPRCGRDGTYIKTLCPPCLRGELKPMVEVAVLHLPQIANFDEFDALACEPGVRLRYVEELAVLGWPDALILPGTKNTLRARAWLRERGLDQAIVALAGTGRAVAGICGGYQLLGRAIEDPHGVDGMGGGDQGLGLLPVDTLFAQSKATYQVEARLAQPLWDLASGAGPLRGYEIHMGRSSRDDDGAALLRLRRAADQTDLLDGCVAREGRVIGTYVHGLFENQSWRRAWLAGLGWAPPSAAAAPLPDEYDRLADCVAENIDMAMLHEIVGA